MKVGKVVQLEKSVTPLLDADLARVQQEALALARAHAADLVAVTTELAALRALLAGAVPLLERAAVYATAHAITNPGNLGRPRAPEDALALRELAQGLRALAPVPEAGTEAEAGEECPPK